MKGGTTTAGALLQIRLDIEGLSAEARERYESTGEPSEGSIAIRRDYLFDYQRHLETLIESVGTNSPEIFTRYLRWDRALLVGHGVPLADLVRVVESLQQTVNDSLSPAVGARLAEVLELGLASLSADDANPTDGDRPLPALAAEYLELLLAGRCREASQRILSAAQQGTPVRELYLDVLQPVQREIGRLWQLNELGVAEEHYCTAAAQLVMAQLFPFLDRAASRNRRAVASCTPGNHHELGARIVADFLEIDGWDTYFVGSNVPTAAIVDCLVRQRADLLALSVSMVTQLEDCREVIRAVRSRVELASIPILVGGPPFLDQPTLWREIGAGASAADADAAVEAANRLIDERRSRGSF